jgi:hypothetical protein
VLAAPLPSASYYLNAARLASKRCKRIGTLRPAPSNINLLGYTSSLRPILPCTVPPVAVEPPRLVYVYLRAALSEALRARALLPPPAAALGAAATTSFTASCCPASCSSPTPEPVEAAAAAVVDAEEVARRRRRRSSTLPAGRSVMSGRVAGGAAPAGSDTSKSRAIIAVTCVCVCVCVCVCEPLFKFRNNARLAAQFSGFN